MKKEQYLLSGWFIFANLFPDSITPKHTSLYTYLLNLNSQDGLITLKETVGLRIISSNVEEYLENIIVFLSRMGFLRIVERPDEGQSEYLLHLLDRSGGWFLESPNSPKPQRTHISWAIFQKIHLDQCIRRRELQTIQITELRTSEFFRDWFEIIAERTNDTCSLTSLLSWIDMSTYYDAKFKINFFPQNAILKDTSFESLARELKQLGFIKMSSKSSYKKYSVCFPKKS